MRTAIALMVCPVLAAAQGVEKVVVVFRISKARPVVRAARVASPGVITGEALPGKQKVLYCSTKGELISGSAPDGGRLAGQASFRCKSDMGNEVYKLAPEK